MSMKLCCLCCTPCRNGYKYLQKDSGECNEIYETTVKYFDPMLLTEHIIPVCSKESSVLCQKCWSHIHNFDNFYQSVIKARTIYEQTNIQKSPLQIKVENDEVSNDDFNVDIFNVFDEEDDEIELEDDEMSSNESEGEQTTLKPTGTAYKTYTNPGVLNEEKVKSCKVRKRKSFEVNKNLEAEKEEGDTHLLSKMKKGAVNHPVLDKGVNLKIERRMLRDSSNPMDLSDYDFGKHFRVNKEIFLKILDAITPHLPERKRTFILPMTKLAVFLNFLGTGSFQNGAGSSWSCKVSQPLVSRIISEHLNVFEDHLCSEYITLNDSLDEDMTKRQYFYRKYKIPGVVGCLGGTHIKINTPSSLIKQDYLNRKGYYSLNVMIICDHNLKIDYIDARYPGSTNDSVIWIDSEARKYFNEQYCAGKRNTWLLGDSNYPLEIFLMTPYQNHVKPHEVKFNECHSKAYNTIRRCIGVLKSRFKSISSEKLYYIPQKATQIINACSVLHNICIKYKDNVALDKVYTTEQCVQDSSDIVPDIDSPTSVAAQEMRNEIANSLLDM